MTTCPGRPGSARFSNPASMFALTLIAQFQTSFWNPETHGSIQTACSLVAGGGVRVTELFAVTVMFIFTGV